MGFVNYYNHFIKNFARIAEPITRLLGSKTEFVWGTEQDSAFCALQVALTSAPVLALLDWSANFDVTTDANIVAVGAELAQRGRPVAYFSKKLTPAKSRYHVTDQEILGLYHACMKWRPYLVGKWCVVRMDHEPLAYIFTQPHLNDR